MRLGEEGGGIPRGHCQRYLSDLWCMRNKNNDLFIHLALAKEKKKKKKTITSISLHYTCSRGNPPPMPLGPLGKFRCELPPNHSFLFFSF